MYISDSGKPVNHHHMRQKPYTNWMVSGAFLSPPQYSNQTSDNFATHNLSFSYLIATIFFTSNLPAPSVKYLFLNETALIFLILKKYDIFK